MMDEVEVVDLVDCEADETEIDESTDTEMSSETDEISEYSLSESEASDTSASTSASNEDTDEASYDDSDTDCEIIGEVPSRNRRRELNPERDAKASAMPKIRKMARISANVPTRQHNYYDRPGREGPEFTEDKWRNPLVLIGDKRRASELFNYYCGEATYVQLVVRGSNVLNPKFVNTIFKCCPAKLNRTNIFVYNQQPDRVKGYVVTKNAFNARYLRELSASTNGLIVYKHIEVRFQLKREDQFRSILNGKVLYEYANIVFR